MVSFYRGLDQGKITKMGGGGWGDSAFTRSCLGKWKEREREEEGCGDFFFSCASGPQERRLRHWLRGVVHCVGWTHVNRTSLFCSLPACLPGRGGCTVFEMGGSSTEHHILLRCSASSFVSMGLPRHVEAGGLCLKLRCRCATTL